MLAKIYSYGISGLDAFLVQIEVSVSGGLPSTIIVGLPDNAIRESKERVRSAIKNSGFSFDPRRITINLSPADIKKEGPSFDLAIALGILAATEQINPDHLQKFAILGELSLDGTVQPIQGALAVIHTLANRSSDDHIPQFEGVLLPKANAAETALYSQIPIFPIKTLNEAVYVLSNPQSHQRFLLNTENISKPAMIYDVDFSDVKGQSFAKRGLEIAAAGGHNVLMLGTQYNRWNLRW